MASLLLGRWRSMFLRNLLSIWRTARCHDPREGRARTDQLF